MSNLAHSPTNDHRMSDLIKEVRAYGRDAEAGKDSLPMFAHKVAETAKDGVINTKKGKDGKDDAARLYGEYAVARGKAAVLETDGESPQNISKLRVIIDAASKPTCDVPLGFSKLKAAFVAKRKAEIKTKPVYHAM